MPTFSQLDSNMTKRKVQPPFSVDALEVHIIRLFVVLMFAKYKGATDTGITFYQIYDILLTKTSLNITSIHTQLFSIPYCCIRLF